MKCRFCGGKSIVTKTISHENTTIRYRKCEKCGDTTTTIEVERYYLKNALYRFIDEIMCD
jgi:transcriptional regulator NrdR family protein